MTRRNTTAAGIGVTAGVLLLISGTSGAASWETIAAFVTEYLTDDHWVRLILAGLIGIASLGGISVICGAILVGCGRITTGKLIIGIGAGIGLIGFAIGLLVTVSQGGSVMAQYSSLGGIGLLLSILARSVARGGRRAPKEPDLDETVEQTPQPPT